MLETFLYWLFLFFVFNVAGWIIESIVESVNHKRLINRGFLAGPYIPIFGVGGIFFAAIGQPLKNAYDSPYVNVFLVFFVGMLVATALEYAAGSILERVFKKQFWDYSTLKLTYKFTYKNRISLVSSLFFGLCSLFMTYFLYGLVSGLTLLLPFHVLAGINIVMALVMVTDTVIQVRRYGHIRDFLRKLSYEELREALHKSLLRMGSRQQISEFRDAVFKNIKNINENVNENIRKLRNGNGKKENTAENPENEETQ